MEFILLFNSASAYNTISIEFWYQLSVQPLLLFLTEPVEKCNWKK